MKSFKAILEESKGKKEIKVKIKYDRYNELHNRTKPKRTAGAWIFTNVRHGKGDVFKAKYGTFRDCMDQAEEWAKSKGYKVIYLMARFESDIKWD